MAEEAVFSFVLETLKELVFNEANFLGGVSDQARELGEELKAMNWFLRDGAANQEGDNSRVLEWVIQVRDLAYEAENVIETYAIKVKSRRGRGVTGKIKRFGCLLNECYLRHQIGSDIESLLKRITSLNNKFRDYGIRNIMEKKDGDSSGRLLPRHTYSTINPHTDLFVGLEEDIKILIGNIVGEKHPAVSICGMGGIGKTTLARKVYHHSTVRSHFDIFSWICISQPWEMKDVLYRILVDLLPDEKEIRESIERWTVDERVGKISSIMQNKKCIIVLDDIWSADVWQNLERALPIGNTGSKVLVTTRNVEVGKCIDAQGFLHRSRLLNKDESWELLSSKALQHRQGGPEALKMEELGREMVSHCGGLPLAVIVLGGLLASRSTYDEWKVVQTSVKSYLRKGNNIGEDQGNIPKILALSYNDLPYQLKPCFLYLSKYAEDQQIEPDTLYQIWIAEGMILSKDKIADDETMMNVAERYLGELAERCMVFIEMEEVDISRGRFKSCRLHDLMRDLCISKAKEENFLELLENCGDISNNTNGASSSSASSSTTRLAIYLTDVKRIAQPAKDLSRRLRSVSIVINGKGYKGRILRFDDFVMLRVLILEGVTPCSDDESPMTFGKICGILVDHLKVPSSIGKLIHLRYLSLRNSDFTILSSAISNLNLLETLDLRSGGIMWIFNFIWKLQSLKHLYLPDILTFHHKMVCRSFDFFFLRLDGLNQLEILDGFNNMYCLTEHLSTLTNLRSLTARIHNTRRNNGLQEFINQVHRLKRLQFLKLKILGMFIEIPLSLLEEMFSLDCLAHLCIVRHIRALPEYQNGFCQNLLSLKLPMSGLVTDPLSTLEKFPKLRNLHLDSWYFEGKQITCHAMGFPKLRSLSIGKAYYLETWEIEKGAMPHLSHLTICGCGKLKMIPDGLRYVTSLKVLLLKYMPAEFVKRVQVNADGEEGEDFDKVRHIEKIEIVQ